MTALRRPWASPLVQFVVASLLLFGLTWWATGIFSQRAARSEAVADARITTDVLANSVAEPAMPRGLVDGDAGAIDRFDREVLDRLIVGDVQRIKIWRSDGTIVYSDETQLIGQRFALDDEQRSVLDTGDTEGGLSDLQRRENEFENRGGWAARGVHPDRVAGGPAAAVRGVLLRRGREAALRRGADAVPAHHGGRAAGPAAPRRTAARRADVAPRPVHRVPGSG